MCPVTDNPASGKIRSVISLLHAKIMSVVEIYCELCAVYEQNVTSEGIMREWHRMFKDGQTNVHDERRSGWPSVVSDSFVQSVD
jgi:hypothetical protein